MAWHQHGLMEDQKRASVLGQLRRTSKVLACCGCARTENTDPVDLRGVHLGETCQTWVSACMCLDFDHFSTCL